MKEKMIREWLIGVSNHLIRIDIAKRKDEGDERSFIIDSDFIKNTIVNNS